jgi:hypothetical protein
MNKTILFLTLLFSFSLVSAQTPEPVPPDSARLSWRAPTQREDSQPLGPNDLLGYEVFWGQSSVPSELSEMVFVDSTITQYMISDLDEGTWFFAVKAVDTNNLKSQFSQVVSKVIEPQVEPPPVDPPSDPQRIGIR